MHPESFHLMKRIIDKHLPDTSHRRVLDVGGADVNGSYRPIFDESVQYETLDRKDASIIVQGYDWPDIGDFDVVISGQTLEHDPKFWLTVKNMSSVTKPGGLIVVIVPSAGPVHRHPVDCYRFLPDSMPVFAEIMEAQLLEVLRDPKRVKWGRAVRPNKWDDVAGVFSKPSAR